MLLLLATLVLIAPATPGQTPGAVPPAATAHGGPPAMLQISGAAVVPRAAAPESGMPGVVEAEEVRPIERKPAPYIMWLPIGPHPLSAFAEPRAPGSPAARRRAKAGRTKEGRDQHLVLPLPHISAQPQIGLMLGGSLNYANRRAGQQFNSAYVQAWSQVSTRLVQDHNLSARLRDLMRHNEVLNFGAMARRDPVFPYYGVANHDNLAGSEFSGPYNWIHMDNYGGWFTYEHPLWQLHRPGRAPGVLRHYSGVFYFVDVIRARPDSRMAEHDPHKTGVERRGVARLGASWDSRDNDWDPSEGSLVDLTFDLAGHYTGSTSNWGRVHLSARNYVRLGTPELVLATRVTFDGLVGTPALMTLGELGGLTPVDAYGGAFVGRGFVRRRFIGNFKALATAELRFTPLERKLGRHTGTMGFELFAEVGAVSQRLVDLDKYIYPSGGPGLLMIWDHFAVFRIEAGFSREGAAVYLQTEHAF